jgi:electron transport complex protein RnfD
MKIAVEKSGPFTHGPSSITRTMTLVLAALLPATLFDVWLFGWPALMMFVVTVGSCVAIEAIILAISDRSPSATLADGSVVLTGWLLAMSMPPWAPWWVCVIGAVFAVGIAKHAFGGLGQNVFNPAMVGRVAVLVSFPLPMTSFVAPAPLGSAHAPGFIDSLGIIFGGAKGFDSLSAASALGHVKTELSRGIPVSHSIDTLPSLTDLSLGLHAGSFGETSALLILLGGLFLIAKRVISWHIPVAVIATLMAFSGLFNAIDPDRFTPAWFHLLSGATMLGAFFIATDYVTSPVTKKGQLVFGFGVGALTWVIRTFAGYPEGMAFAVLLMNALTPIIDHHIRPRAFGRTRKGDPLPLPAKGEK